MRSRHGNYSPREQAIGCCKVAVNSERTPGFPSALPRAPGDQLGRDLPNAEMVRQRISRALDACLNFELHF
jgi:hypothetical protein